MLIVGLELDRRKLKQAKLTEKEADDLKDAGSNHTEQLDVAR